MTYEIATARTVGSRPSLNGCGRHREGQAAAAGAALFKPIFAFGNCVSGDRGD